MRHLYLIWCQLYETSLPDIFNEDWYKPTSQLSIVSTTPTKYWFGNNSEYWLKTTLPDTLITTCQLITNKQHASWTSCQLITTCQHANMPANNNMPAGRITGFFTTQAKLAITECPAIQEPDTYQQVCWTNNNMPAGRITGLIQANSWYKPTHDTSQLIIVDWYKPTHDTSQLIIGFRDTSCQLIASWRITGLIQANSLITSNMPAGHHAS